jgi:hypothetical protein
MRLPTDRQILEAVYRRYYSTFAQFSREGDGRETKVHVPIDVASIAAGFGVDADIIFGRLYYHLEQKYGYEGSGKVRVPFFSLQVGADRHCVNFPLLASVLASLRTEHLRFRLATTLSIISIVISAMALAISLSTTLFTFSPRP